MILIWLILIPLIGGLAASLPIYGNNLWPRRLSIIALSLDAVLLASLWPGSPEINGWIHEINAPWIPQLGITLHFALDGVSLVLIALTLFLGIISVLCSWTEITERTGFFHLNLMAVITGIIGVFMALDLFLFYFFWELMLVPMYFLISIWGHENRAYASLKFFIFTQAGGLLMLISILGLYFAHAAQTNVYTFDLQQLIGTNLSDQAGFWLMLGFFISFMVKLPAFPFHPWLADAHTEAPTAGSVILAGLMLKTGAYGLFRFVLPLFPDAASSIAPAAITIAVISIIYGAVLAFAQSDLKRLVAYTSVSHMGFVLLGVFAFNVTAMQGAVMEMVAHGISTGALFVLVGMIQERIHTRDMNGMGGFWALVPRLSAIGLVFGLATLGLPGFGNFVAEFMVLLGSFRVNITATVIAAAGLVFAAIYSLWMVQRTFQGEPNRSWSIRDLSIRESGMMAAMIVVIIWLGLFPHSLLAITERSVTVVQGTAAYSYSQPDGRPLTVMNPGEGAHE